MLAMTQNGLGRAFWRTLIGRAWRLAALCLLAITLTVKADVSGDYVYTDNLNGTVRIDEYTGSGSLVDVPNIIAGKTVVGIGRYAFSACASLTSVTIPDSVLYLEEYAFDDCANLSSVTIGTGVTSIGFRVFDDCPNLTIITVAVGNTAYSSLDNVLFNDAQTALIQCPGGRAGSYTIPDGVTSVERGAFFWCTRLDSVTIASTVTNIAKEAFWSCTSLGGIVIPNSVAVIGDDAFWGCTNMASATIGASVASIGEWAFYECTRLTSITIPASVTNIGYGAFVRCTSLAAITVDAANAGYSSSDGVLFNTNRTTLVQCPGAKASYAIPAGVTSIGAGAFYWCASLGSVTIPASVTNIGDNGFAFCPSLAAITLPNSVADIGHYAFQNCTSLGSITIPAGVTSLKYWTFISCRSLSAVTVAASVTNIDDDVFASCTNLAGVYFRGNAPGGSTNMFYNDENVTVYYVAGAMGWGPTFAGRPTALWSNASPAPIIKVNGAVGTVTVNYPETVSVTVEIDAGSYVGVPVDWWVIAQSGSSWFYRDSATGWTEESNLHNWRPAYQAGLFNLPAFEVLRITGLLRGSYKLYFAVDYPMDGVLNLDGIIFMDTVDLIVQ